jgi:hypothetical protein
MIIQRPEHYRVAAFGAFVGQPGRDAFGRTKIGTEQHQQRGVVPIGRRDDGRQLLGGCGWRGQPNGRCIQPAIRSGNHLDPHLIRFDGQRRLDLELIVEGVDEVEALQ